MCLRKTCKRGKGKLYLCLKSVAQVIMLPEERGNVRYTQCSSGACEKKDEYLEEQFISLVCFNCIIYSGNGINPSAVISSAQVSDMYRCIIVGFPLAMMRYYILFIDFISRKVLKIEPRSRRKNGQCGERSYSGD